jgi:hypothetical protein
MQKSDNNTIKNIAIASVEIAGKTLISTLPGGTVVTSVFDAIKGGCLEKRQAKWRESIEDRLSTVEETLEDLGNNEIFTTTILKATEMAMKTLSEEKREFLANAVLNACYIDVEEEKLLVFLDLLDRYTISHLKILVFFHNPKAFDIVAQSSYYMGSPTEPLFHVYPELNNKLFRKIYKDLYLDGMVNTEDLNVTMTGNGMIAKRTTDLADELLNFIFDKRD